MEFSVKIKGIKIPLALPLTVALAPHTPITLIPESMLEFYLHELYAHDALRAYDSPVAKDKTTGQITNISPPPKKKKKEDDNEKYKSEAYALEKIFGTLNPGMNVILTLQELLKIVPRNRKRTDAYTGLVGYLHSRGVTLTIKSSKPKK